MSLFSYLNKLIPGHFHPLNISLILNETNFRGDLTNISAKTKTLVPFEVQIPGEAKGKRIGDD